MFLKLNRFRVPYVAVMASVAWGGIAFLSLDKGAYQVGKDIHLLCCIADEIQVFVWLVSLVTTSGIMSWVVIGITYIRFFNALKEQNISRSDLPYRSPYQPYLTVS